MPPAPAPARQPLRARAGAQEGKKLAESAEKQKKNQDKAMQLMQDGKSEKAVKLLKGDNHQMQIIGEQKVVAEAKVKGPPSARAGAPA